MKARLVGISLFCAVLWCNIPTGATTPTDTVLAVTPSDARYLVYYDLVNMFDSVSVRFTYGEILLVHGQQKTRI